MLKKTDIDRNTLISLLNIALECAWNDMPEEAIALSEFLTPLLKGTSFDMCRGVILVNSGEVERGLALLKKVAKSGEAGAEAMAVLSLHLAVNGYKEWKLWADKACNEPDATEHTHQFINAIVEGAKKQGIYSGRHPESTRKNSVLTPIASMA